MTLSVLGQTGVVQGKVFFKRDLEALTGVGIFLPARSLGATSDLEGNYRLELDSGMHNLIVQSIGFATDTIMNVSVLPNKITQLNIGLPYYLDCDGSPSKICPIGNKSDDVIPIVYGLPGSKLMRKSEKGKVYLGGCVITGCDPKWYCKTHKKMF